MVLELLMFLLSAAVVVAGCISVVEVGEEES